MDRVQQGHIEPHATACLEFARDAGLWSVVEFADEDAAARWEAPVRSAMLLLADSGFGGERSRGWGRSETPEWEPWSPPQARSTEEPSERAYWLLSVFTPSPADAVDWSRGSYSTVSRRGRIESSARWGEPKSATLMIAEGSVLFAGGELQGAASDVAPAGFPHPVYRAGICVDGANPMEGGDMSRVAHALSVPRSHSCERPLRGFDNTEHRQECRRGTHECVRHRAHTS